MDLNEFLQMVVEMAVVFTLLAILTENLNKLISYWFVLKGKNLRYSIYLMLAESDAWKVLFSKACSATFLKTGNSLAQDFYSHSLVKRVARKYQDQPDLVEKEMFVKVILSVLNLYGKKNGTLEQKLVAPLDMREIKRGIEALSNGQVKRRLLTLYSQSKSDLDVLRTNIGEWYDHGVAATKRRYELFIQYIGVVVALILLLSFKIDPLDYVKQSLEIDNQNSELIRQQDVVIKVFKDRVFNQMGSVITDTTNLEAFVYRLAIEKPPEFILTDSTDLNWVDEFNKSLHVKIREFLISKESSNESKLLSDLYASVDSLVKEALNDLPVETQSTQFEIENLLVLILTAISISLGSSTWFDLVTNTAAFRRTVKPVV